MVEHRWFVFCGEHSMRFQGMCTSAVEVYAKHFLSPWMVIVGTRKLIKQWNDPWIEWQHLRKAEQLTAWICRIYLFLHRNSLHIICFLNNGCMNAKIVEESLHYPILKYPEKWQRLFHNIDLKRPMVQFTLAQRIVVGRYRTPHSDYMLCLFSAWIMSGEDLEVLVWV